VRDHDAARVGFARRALRRKDRNFVAGRDGLPIAGHGNHERTIRRLQGLLLRGRRRRARHWSLLHSLAAQIPSAGQAAQSRFDLLKFRRVHDGVGRELQFRQQLIEVLNAIAGVGMIAQDLRRACAFGHQRLEKLAQAARIVARRGHNFCARDVGLFFRRAAEFHKQQIGSGAQHRIAQRSAITPAA
jgi:hypothetical protein